VPERCGVCGDGCRIVSAHPVARPVDVDQPERGHLAELQDPESGAAGGMLPGRKRKDADRDMRAAGAHLGEVAQLGTGHLRRTDLLAQRGLPDHDCQGSAALVQCGLLAVEFGGCQRGLGVLGNVGVRADEGACVVGGLQQPRDARRGVGEDRGGGFLDFQELAVGAAQGKVIAVAPAPVTGPAGDGGQGILSGGIGAIFGQQLAQFLGPDAALSGLDPAYLRPVTLQDLGGHGEVVAEIFPVPAQGRADQPPPDGQ
jgi:hypothetical protein